MPVLSVDPEAFYAQHGMMSDPGEYAARFDVLPADLPSLCQVVQGIMLHVFWAQRYGLILSEERSSDVQIRPMVKKMPRLLALDDRPLSETRPIERRLVGNCRDFTVMLTSFLRHHGVPARARCGFGTYFAPGKFEDHWVCEYWNADQCRWILVDAQLDELQREALDIHFDPLDVPRDAFVVAGQAWLACRRMEVDPNKFGIFDMHGLWFVRGNVVRDFLALNKVEILPWDHWGIMCGTDEEMTPEQNSYLDEIARLTLGGDAAFPTLCRAFEEGQALRPSQGWESLQ